MFIDYQTRISEDYERKKSDNTLSPRLTLPTSAKIREECIAVCTERYRSTDEKALRTFFGKQESPAEYIKAIKKHDLDKFKPLVNYLRNPKINTDEKNVELLAWLIDFKPRPYQFGKRYDNLVAEDEDAIMREKQGDTDQAEEEKVINEDNTLPVSLDKSVTVETDPLPEPIAMPLISQRRIGVKASSVKKITAITGALLILLSTGYGVFQGIHDPVSGKEGCMYWAGDHYVQVPCIQRFRDTVVVALDTFKLENFKKITQPDTITLKAIGRVWYVKMDNEIEYFTAKGCHPVYQQRHLKPITEYIIKKYILHN